MLCWVSQAQGFLGGLDLSGILLVWCPDQRSHRRAAGHSPDFLRVGGGIMGGPSHLNKPSGDAGLVTAPQQTLRSPA